MNTSLDHKPVEQKWSLTTERYGNRTQSTLEGMMNSEKWLKDKEALKELQIKYQIKRE